VREEFRSKVNELSIKPMTPLTEGTKSNVNPPPKTPRPDFTPAGQGVPIQPDGAAPSSSPQPSSPASQASQAE